MVKCSIVECKWRSEDCTCKNKEWEKWKGDTGKVPLICAKGIVNYIMLKEEIEENLKKNLWD